MTSTDFEDCLRHVTVERLFNSRSHRSLYVHRMVIDGVENNFRLSKAQMLERLKGKTFELNFQGLFVCQNRSVSSVYVT